MKTTATVVTEPLLTPAEAAELLRVRPSWVYEAVRGRRLPHVKVGKRIRFERAALEDWISGRRVAARH